MYFFVETAGAHGCRVQGVLVVGSTNDHDPVVLLKTVHFSEQLVDGSPARAVLASETPGLAHEGVDLIDEDDAWSVLSGLSEELADTFGTKTDVHLVEGAARSVDEAHIGLTSDGSCQKSLACAWWSGEENALVELGALAGVLAGVLDHLDEVLDLVRDLADTLHVVQSLLDVMGLLDLELELVISKPIGILEGLEVLVRRVVGQHDACHVEHVHEELATGVHLLIVRAISLLDHLLEVVECIIVLRVHPGSPGPKPLLRDLNPFTECLVLPNHRQIEAMLVELLKVLVSSLRIVWILLEGSLHLVKSRSILAAHVVPIGVALEPFVSEPTGKAPGLM